MTAAPTVPATSPEEFRAAFRARGKVKGEFERVAYAVLVPGAARIKMVVGGLRKAEFWLAHSS